MHSSIAQLFSKLAHSNAILVRVQATEGSVPREVGAWMAVFTDSIVATVGGGRLELDAIAHARSLLVHAEGERIQHYALGPSLGQCCGGRVTLAFYPITAEDETALRHALRPARVPVALFGSGHVGTALVHVMGLLPVELTWIDSRDQTFPPDLPGNVQTEHSNPVQGAVAQLASQSRVLIMSFSHAEDLDIVQACLTRQRAKADLPFIGLIGSKTKWATFRSRLEAKGFSSAELAQVTCPIGMPGIQDKRPEVIAVAVAAQLMMLAG
jgi:xanthine dehydrogenase accessory factor